MNKFIRYILLFVFCFFIAFLYNYYLLNINCDVVWSYGFSYNISKGLVIYRDFNVLQTPLFFFIGSIFIKIFGNHMYAYDIYCAFLVGIIIVLCYKKMGKVSLLFFFLIVVNLISTYNSLCFLLMIILLIVNDSHYDNKNFIMGILVSLLFLTKQNIGICIFIITLFISMDKIKYLFSFLIPILIFSIYLIYNDALFCFIDCAFLGLFEFGNSNMLISPYIIIFVITILFLFYKIIKTRFNDKNLLLILCFQSMSYPIFDRNHVMFGFCLLIFYLLYEYKECLINNYKYFFVMFFSYFVFICGSYKEDYHFYNNNNSFLNGKGVFGYWFNMSIPYDEIVSKLEGYMKKYITGYDYIFVYSVDISELAYISKIDLGIPIGNYDFILKGNMGYNGGKRRINDIDNICKDNKCIFFIDNRDDDYASQIDRSFIKYVINNYNTIDSIDDGISFTIYGNE